MDAKALDHAHSWSMTEIAAVGRRDRLPLRFEIGFGKQMSVPWVTSSTEGVTTVEIQSAVG